MVRLPRSRPIALALLALLALVPVVAGAGQKKGDDHNLAVVIKDIHGKWDKARFRLKRLPASIKKLRGTSKAKASDPKPQYNNMLVSSPGGELRLPTDDPTIKTFVDEAMAYERHLLPDFDKTYFVYLTVHQKMVEPGKSQRTPGAHIDGMQGARYPEKFEMDHMYTMATNHPTASYPQSFPMSHLDEHKDNFFEAFQQRIKDKGFLPVSGDSHTIELVSGYQVHESPIVNEKALRTFYRLDITKKKFDDVRDTENPLLVRDWSLKDRALSPELQKQETLFKSRVGGGGAAVRKEGRLADGAVLDQLRRQAKIDAPELDAFDNQTVRNGVELTEILHDQATPGQYVYLGHDDHGKDRSDPQSKFVLVRDVKAVRKVGVGRRTLSSDERKREHIVAIATPDPTSHQPVHLHDMVDLPPQMQHLGRMVRGALFSAEQVHGDGAGENWQAAISLADSVTMPALHVNAHYLWRPTQLTLQSRDWLKEVKKRTYKSAMGWRTVGPGKYRVYVHPTPNQALEGYPVVAVATDPSGKPLTPAMLAGGNYDELLARMVLDVYRTCESRQLRHGQIEVDRSGNQLVVKAHVWPPE